MTKEIIITNINKYEGLTFKNMKKSGYIKTTYIMKYDKFLGSIKLKTKYYFFDKTYDNLSYQDFQKLVHGGI